MSDANDTSGLNATLGLALCDFAPNLLFLAGSVGVALASRAGGAAGAAAMYLAGAGLAFVAGLLKASSKLRDALARRPVSESGLLYDQMLPVMAIGFLGVAAASLERARLAGGAGGFGAGIGIVAHAAAALLLGGAVIMAIRVNGRAPGLRLAFEKAKRASLVAMVAFQLANLGILAFLAFKGGQPLAGALVLLSALTMLAMGALGSPSLQARFQNRIAMNWAEQGINILSQACYAVAAAMIYAQAAIAR